MNGGQRSPRMRVWQLSDQLRSAVANLTAGETLCGDHKLRSQIDDAAGEVCRNIAEAFGTDRDREFARFVRLARAAVTDLQDGLRVAVMKKYVTEPDLKSVGEILGRLYPALSSLLAHGNGPVHRQSA
jgi:four helix bundle protein